MGSRSSGPRKVWRLGAADDYLLRANEETIVWPQIETAGALESIDEFLEVEGIDGIMIGPSDLSYALGNQPPDLIPQAEEAIQLILDKCKEHGVPWGMFSGLEAGEKWIRRGGPDHHDERRSGPHRGRRGARSGEVPGNRGEPVAGRPEGFGAIPKGHSGEESAPHWVRHRTLGAGDWIPASAGITGDAGG